MLPWRSYSAELTYPSSGSEDTCRVDDLTRQRLLTCPAQGATRCPSATPAHPLGCRTVYWPRTRRAQLYGPWSRCVGRRPGRAFKRAIGPALASDQEEHRPASTRRLATACRQCCALGCGQCPQVCSATPVRIRERTRARAVSPSIAAGLEQRPALDARALDEATEECAVRSPWPGDG